MGGGVRQGVHLPKNFSPKLKKFIGRSLQMSVKKEGDTEIKSEDKANQANIQNGN